MASGSKSPIPQDFRGKWMLLPQYRTKDYPEGASFEMNIDEHRVVIDYDLEMKAPSQWTPEGFHQPTVKEVYLESAEQTPRQARMRWSPNKIEFQAGTFYGEYERAGTQEESQLGWGLLFVVVFFFIAFYLSKK